MPQGAFNISTIKFGRETVVINKKKPYNKEKPVKFKRNTQRKDLEHEEV